jgi:hypothetical protein
MRRGEVVSGYGANQKKSSGSVDIEQMPESLAMARSNVPPQLISLDRPIA